MAIKTRSTIMVTLAFTKFLNFLEYMARMAAVAISVKLKMRHVYVRPTNLPLSRPVWIFWSRLCLCKEGLT